MPACFGVILSEVCMVSMSMQNRYAMTMAAIPTYSLVDNAGLAVHMSSCHSQRSIHQAGTICWYVADLLLICNAAQQTTARH